VFFIGMTYFYKRGMVRNRLVSSGSRREVLPRWLIVRVMRRVEAKRSFFILRFKHLGCFHLGQSGKTMMECLMAGWRRVGLVVSLVVSLVGREQIRRRS
jgi:hypothetical protein